jgi:hypothetical protein
MKEGIKSQINERDDDGITMNVGRKDGAETEMRRTEEK